ncbi:MAG: four-carbon acid sugar kinase family protein [Candidimonas sp.]|nr:MAG: four-carbon acid sugar kinase family protein [Candidimonas sp.]TAM22987.1 MAG: four-carbon acid sugar kinase family protein [Candidimonas sp.]TAM77347.1 MAG: four-carbon acid sugar kinase family protein [Candidimonas sp.]
MAIQLGCIADDFTGATDLANNLVRAGMTTVQTIGVPVDSIDTDAQALVVSLKSRSIPASDAVAQSVAAARWLLQQGASQLYFKYCSTFDSTSEGNIGPVTDALMDLTGCDFTVACPAFPDNGRTVFKGYLFAGDVLLNESGMQHHPITPMTDPNLVRVLQAQTRRKVGLIDYSVVVNGVRAINERIDTLKREGVSIAILDAISNDDLLTLGRALHSRPLLTAGSGLAIGLPSNWGIGPSVEATRLEAPWGRAAIICGSCSSATRAQVGYFLKHGGQALALDPQRLLDGEDLVQAALEWVKSQSPEHSVLIYTTATPEAVKHIRARAAAVNHDMDISGQLEQILARIARELLAMGVGRLLVAGGETSGAVVQALGIAQLRIGPQIDPGVPWCTAWVPAFSKRIHLSLKSGNFGSVDFFHKAFALID